MSDRYTICEHGSQKHKCEACQFRDERDDALARIAELEAENRPLTEAGQLNVLADIREIVDPMSPGRMMQSELVDRIREIVTENARLREGSDKRYRIIRRLFDGFARLPSSGVGGQTVENCLAGERYRCVISGTLRAEMVEIICEHEAAALAAKERQR